MKDTTWILVSDASRARFFETTKPDRDWALVEEIDHPPGRAHGKDITTDRPGSVRQIGGQGSRAGMAPHTDPRKVEAAQFARNLAERLKKGHSENRYGKLLLVAPPSFLGLLRDVLPKGVENAVTATVAKDLTQLEARDLPGRLAGSF